MSHVQFEGLPTTRPMLTCSAGSGDRGGGERVEKSGPIGLRLGVCGSRCGSRFWMSPLFWSQWQEKPKKGRGQQNDDDETEGTSHGTTKHSHVTPKKGHEGKANMTGTRSTVRHGIDAAGMACGPQTATKAFTHERSEHPGKCPCNGPQGPGRSGRGNGGARMNPFHTPQNYCRHPSTHTLRWTAPDT